MASIRVGTLYLSGLFAAFTTFGSEAAPGKQDQLEPLRIEINVENDTDLALLLAFGAADARRGRFLYVDHAGSPLPALLDALGIQYEIMTGKHAPPLDSVALAGGSLPDGEWTVITHGAHGAFSLTNCNPALPNVPSWVNQFAEEIKALDPGNVQIHSMDPDTFTITPSTFNPSMHHVLVWNWSATSAIFCKPKDLEVGPDGYAYAAGDALYAFLKHHGIAEKASYFIGHSRGAVVVSEAVRRLILDGIDPRQVIYLDGEGGNCFGLGYQDDRFDAWAPCNPLSEVRYDALYETLVESCCYPCNGGFGGLPSAGNRLHLTNLGTQYRHGECSDPPLCDPITERPIWEFLFDSMTFNNELYRWPGQPPDSNSVGPPLDADNWDGYPNDYPMFNGDFEWGSMAGWNNHGGGGTGNVDSLFSCGDYLSLNDNDDILEHSWFWLPEEFDRFRFKYKIFDPDVFFCNDGFSVILAKHGGPALQVFFDDRCDIDFFFTTVTIDLVGQLETFRGSLCQVRFSKTSGDLDSTTHVNGCSVESFLKSCQTPSEPQNASASPMQICGDGCSTLTAQVPGAVIDWYTEGCGGTFVGTGNSIVVCPTETTTYSAQARSGDCSSACCQDVTVFVSAQPPTPTNASGPDICTGGCSTLMASVPGAVIDWYKSTCSGTPIGTGNSIVVCPTASTVYHARARDPQSGCVSEGCDFVVVEVEPDPSITISSDQTIRCGGSATLTASASGGVINCSFQWEKSLGGCGGPWQEIPGAMSSSYNTGALSTSTWYRCRRSCNGSGCDDATSNCATVSVLTELLPGTITGSGGTVPWCGDPLPMTANPSGGTGEFTYQWYYVDGETCPSVRDAQLIPGATGPMYDPPAPLTTESRSYQCFVSLRGPPDCGKAAWTDNCITVSVGPPSIDLDCSGFVDEGDITEMFLRWGPCADCGFCPGDIIDDNCEVGIRDFLTLLSKWGTLP